MRQESGQWSNLQGELLQSDTRYRELLNAMSEGFVAMDEDFRVIDINSQGLRLDGRPAQDILGRSHWDLWPTSLGTPLEEAYRKVMRERVPVELEHHHVSDRHDFWMRIRAYPITGGIAVLYRDVTQARLAESAVRHSEERFRAAISAVGVLWTNDAQGRMTGEQPGWEALTGQTRQAYEGYGWADAVHPEDAQPTVDAWKAAVAEGRPFHFEHRVRTREGTWRRYTIRAVPLKDCEGRIREWVGVHIDMTDAARAAEANAKFRALFDQGSSFAGIMALDGTLIEANHLSLTFCGFQREDVIGKPFWACGWWNRSPELMAMVREGVAEAATGRTFRRETPYFLADGSIRHVDLIISPVLDPQGRVIYIAPTGTDITDKKHNEQALQRLADELAEVDQRKTRFLATLAHELRNPLAPLRNGLHIMQVARNDGMAVEKAREMMCRQLSHMVRLIDDLLDVARIAGGKLDLQKQTIALRDIVASAVETSQPLIEASQHVLSVQMADAPIWLDADPARLAQVISNLLNNAARYTPRGGRITLKAELLPPNAQSDAQAVITVSDNGIGIPKEAQTLIFDMFTQVQRKQPMGEGGLGIGLSLVKQLVALHGGQVEVASEGHGRGSTMTVRLPALRPALAPRTQHREAADAQQHAHASTRPLKQVLIVDDNVDAAESLSLMIGLLGHDTVVAHSGSHALQQALQRPPDIAFLDIGLPDMDGYEVARRLRAEPALRHVTLVALTGWGTEQDQRKAHDMGFDTHVTKPAEPRIIQAILGEASDAQLAVATGT
ncbi:MAG: PAS domain-containing protein [Aquabacterium sp.]